ncbi:hypothetical protein GLYMA_07G117500v4 [Glycine max]|uniref:transcription factor bHLH25-like isoform X1 n=1 Tax=Glycine max TaxID=3847 RepID=UPI0003DEBB94|nr:uncharacterized protein LOC100799087 isoform X1 [Glycine max]XP_028240190.1 transcription factor bHLH25-like isoform X2 [Glycine soja]KAG4400723.1 hypothetical protein GLYMA_07G117500v4 [Glycine max]KAH1086452.1 hypothetical protein GYH30_018122 [Glycine max]|eukprot:XP_006582927.1 uncharacterized protein LOC100799087 isoform X1 [Glycine max]
MEESPERWLRFLEMDECNLFGHMHSLVEVFKGENLVQQEKSCKSHPCDSNITKESTTILLRNPINDSSSLEKNPGFDNRSSLKQHASQDEPLFSSSSMPYTLSFEDSTAVPYVLNKTCQCYHGENSKETQEEPKNNRKSKRGRSSSEIQDHIMSERKRRENIAKLFIALSAVIPVLKKKRVKDLEEESKKRKVEYAVCFKTNKYNIGTVVDDSDIPINIRPKIEARVSGKDALIKVMCEKRKDIVAKILGKLAALNLSIVCCNVLPFANSALNITCIAQMDHEFTMTLDDLVKILTEDLFDCCN